MGWQDLLATTEERALPWGGGPNIAWGHRVWEFNGRRPPEHGWYKFAVDGTNKVKLLSRDQVDPDPDFETEKGHKVIRGYLVGNRLIPDTAQLNVDPDDIVYQTYDVNLVDIGLDRFTRAVAVQNKLGVFYVRQEFPQGQEDEITMAYQDRKGDDAIAAIPGVTPALELAFRWLSMQRLLAEAHEAEMRKLRDENEKKRIAEEKHAEARRSIGTGAGRRAVATHDFPTAAKAALAVSGAELLDARRSSEPGEWVVQYRFMERRLECTCDITMHIIDAGICLSAGGVKGDTRFTLESLPAVVSEAINRGILHVYRYAPGDRGYDDDDW